MNLAIGDILNDVAPNVGDAGACVATNRQAVVDAINRAQRLLIYRLDAKGTIWPRCVRVREECFALPPEIEEVRSIKINGRGAMQRDASFESHFNIGHRGGNTGWIHFCHGYELIDLGDGWPLPAVLPQIANGHLAFTCQLDTDAGAQLNVQVLNRYNDWVNETITLLTDQQMAYTGTDCYDMKFCRKPITVGNVNVYYVSPDTSYCLQAVYGPKVTTPSYRRKRLPKHGHGHGYDNDHHRRFDEIQLQGKLRYFPAQDDADQLVIGNLDAIIWGVKAIVAQTMGDAATYSSFLGEAVNELEQELRNDESEATVAPLEVHTGVSFNSRRYARHWR